MRPAELLDALREIHARLWKLMREHPLLPEVRKALEDLAFLAESTLHEGEPHDPA
jgi:hypothetical protein